MIANNWKKCLAKHRMSVSIPTMQDDKKMPVIRVNKDYRDLLYNKPRIFEALSWLITDCAWSATAW